MLKSSSRINEIFTVGNAKEARKSVVYATGFVTYFG